MAFGIGSGPAILSIFLLAPIAGPIEHHYSRKPADSAIVKQQQTSETTVMSKSTIDQINAIKKVFDRSADKGSAFERSFIGDNAKRIEQDKENTRFSEKQSGIATQIYEKYKE